MTVWASAGVAVLLAWFLLGLAEAQAQAQEQVAFECDLVQVVTELGVGLFAGRDFEEDDVVEHSLGVPVPTSVHQKNILDNYVEGYWLENYNLATFGYAMVYNHAPASFYNLDKHVANDSVLSSITPFNASEPDGSIVVTYTANRPIARGEQVLNYYGETWFNGDATRPPAEINPCSGDENLCRISLDASSSSRKTLPGCPMQFTRLERGQLFAARDIPAGTVIEVSRALLMPLTSLAGAGNVLSLLWFFKKDPTSEAEKLAEKLLSTRARLLQTDFGGAAVIEAEGASSAIGADGGQEFFQGAAPAAPLVGNVALLLLGWGSFYSPRGSGGAANVAFSQFSGLDGSAATCKKDGTMFVQFTSLRDVPQGELLTVDLGQLEVPADAHSRNTYSPSANVRRLAPNQDLLQGCV